MVPVLLLSDPLPGLNSLPQVLHVGGECWAEMQHQEVRKQHTEKLERHGSGLKLCSRRTEIECACGSPLGKEMT